MRELGVDVDEHLESVAASTLPEITAALHDGLSRSRALAEADLVLVQGDTTTAFAGALVAFLARVPVGHVEAGLRSGSLESPFPEEAHRRLIAQLSSIHFAPTAHSRQNLLREGIDEGCIALTGNTVVDALATMLSTPFALPVVADGNRIILVTLHRRETWGIALERACAAIGDTIKAHPDVRVIFPVHMNPSVRETVERVLLNHPQVDLLPPLGYRAFLAQLLQASFVVTDSGGVQEEASVLGRRVLVLRSHTDRPESIDAGLARLVGTDARHVHEALEAELRTPAVVAPTAIYGDGYAAARIASAIERWRDGLTPLLPAPVAFSAGSARPFWPQEPEHTM
jgi:UDP-N-acetylglucosamine 2-epimerase (non-hydrolysing)